MQMYIKFFYLKITQADEKKITGKKKRFLLWTDLLIFRTKFSLFTVAKNHASLLNIINMAKKLHLNNERYTRKFYHTEKIAI